MKISREAATANATAKYINNELEAKSLAEFGVTVKELADYTPANEQEVK